MSGRTPDGNREGRGARRRLLPLLIVACAGATGSARSGDVWSDPHPGMRRLHRVTADQNINVLEIDLCAEGISLRATASDERHRTTSSFAGLVDAQAAVNGDFYVWDQNYRTDGLAMSGGSQWWDTNDHAYTAPVAFGYDRADTVPHWVVAGPESWMLEIVSGHPTILRDGSPIDNNGDTLCTVRHPRTVAGFSQDRFTLLLAVVDGRAPGRVGMTCDELIALMQELGAWDAVNLDGGGSSTMWIEGSGVANFPSGGGERAVANHLAVRAVGSDPPVSCRPGPRAVTGLRFTGRDTFDWGESTLHRARYDLLRGPLSELRADGTLQGATCLDNDRPQARYTDGAIPAPGEAFYYVVREQAPDGSKGTYDSSTLPSLRERRDEGVGVADCP